MSCAQAGFGERSGGTPKISVLRAGVELSKVLWSEEVPYSFIAEGAVAEDFEIGCEEGEVQVDEAALVPREAEVPKERGLRVGDPLLQSSDAESDEEITGQGGERRWYDDLPGDPLCLDDSAEDLVEMSELLEDLDIQRSSKVRVIREQEVCLKAEAEAGEGEATKSWLRDAYRELGELEAQMSCLNAEMLQSLGQSSVRMNPSLFSMKEAGPLKPEAEVLHTHAVPLSEVYANIESWRPSLLDEFNSIVTTHQAMRPITRSEIKGLEKEGKQIQYVPGKLVATVKAGTAAKKARIVACGNFLSKERPHGSPTLSKSDIFAGALDSPALGLS